MMVELPGHESSNLMTARLSQLLVEVGGDMIESDVAAQFGRYLEILMRWNARMNLTAVRDAELILRRHFVESILCARALPRGVETVLDFGSGAGFPGLPIAICRPEIKVTLAESQSKKAAFLREAVRAVGMGAVVHSGRAELLETRFSCVTLRAVEQMNNAISLAAKLVAEGGLLAVMTTRDGVVEIRGAAESDSSRFRWDPPIESPAGTRRVLLFGWKDGSGRPGP